MNIRRHRLAMAVTAIALALPLPVLADAVTYWNEYASGAVIAPTGSPPQQARVTAMVQIAVHDALNAIDPRYKAYNVLGTFKPSASPDAAVARATCDVLVGVLPAASHAAVEGKCAEYLATLACPTAHPGCIAQGEAAGAAAAAAMLAARHLDGSENPHRPYTLAAAPGVHQDTGGGVLFGGWGDVRTFAIGSASQFPPGKARMLHLRSPQYAADYNEVKAIGSAAVRGHPDNVESEESRIARFWAGSARDYNRYTRTILAGMAPRDTWDNARLFALVNLAVADAIIATFRVKYQYNFWRPVTAIRWGEEGNPMTTHAPEDATWTPYITTPPYPDYTCGQPTLISGSTAMLREYFGTDDIAFDHSSAGMTRHFDSLSQAANEVAVARVYSGIHFRTGCLRALEQADDIAGFVYQTQLQPRRK